MPFHRLSWTGLARGMNALATHMGTYGKCIEDEYVEDVRGIMHGKHTCGRIVSHELKSEREGRCMAIKHTRNSLRTNDAIRELE